MSAAAWSLALTMCPLRLGAKRALTAPLAPAVLVISCAVTNPAPAGSAERQTLPTHVNAVYRISFTALGKIGTFHFKSDITGDVYALSADAKVSTYIFGYKGQMSSAGTLPAAQAQPANYTYSYKQKALFGTKKVSTLNMAFDPAGVSRVNFVPPEKLSKNAVPVLPSHLKSVLDPLSGIMALSLANLAKPCEERLPIYDGQQRFDVVFAPSGIRAEVNGDHVCVVHVEPISGHKKGEGAGAVVDGNIEVMLRPVFKANVIIPLKVTVPTKVGTAVLTSERVDITMPDQQHIALQR
jgi:hypothetical protein